MFHIEVPKVRGKMAERGYTITSLAQRLEVSRNTLSSYLEAPWKTPYEVVSGMAEALCETQAEAEAIFFARDIREKKEKRDK